LSETEHTNRYKSQTQPFYAHQPAKELCVKRWSKLQRELYKLVAQELDFQIHCTVYPMHSQYGNTGLPRYWITLNKEIIWDYPKQFADMPTHQHMLKGYPDTTDISDISDLIREYIDTPTDDLLAKHFENDHWGLANILRAADRRVLDNAV
jgi:hypothetical protein